MVNGCTCNCVRAHGDYSILICSQQEKTWVTEIRKWMNEQNVNHNMMWSLKYKPPTPTPTTTPTPTPHPTPQKNNKNTQNINKKTYPELDNVLNTLHCQWQWQWLNFIAMHYINNTEFHAQSFIIIGTIWDIVHQSHTWQKGLEAMAYVPQ